MSDDAFDTAFDRLMETVGYRGRFQMRFNILFNVIMVLFASFVYNSMIFIFATPEHWCHVPGRELTNMTDLEWKHATVPRNSDGRGGHQFSNCLMFNLSGLTIAGDGQLGNTGDVALDDHSTVGCQHGWVYDKQWYESTAVSQENWVCEKDLYQTNTFAFGRLGEVIGSLVFGQMGDRLGRRLTFYISVLLMLVGKIGMVFSVTHYTWLIIAAMVGSLTLNTTFQAPLIIAMEVSPAENRASIVLMQNVTWSVAMCVMPMLYWLIREWQMFFWVTTLPLAAFICIPGYMIESPRWLATTGRLAECAKYLTVIARINGRTDTEITETYLKKMLPESSSGTSSEQVYGIWSFFTNWRMARNTSLMIFCWVVCSLAYFTLLLSVADLPGNPFVNFLIQSLVEFPSYFIGQRLCNTIGRRLTNSLAFGLAGLLSLLLVGVLNFTTADAIYTITLTFAIKFCTSVTFFAVNLQAMETHPTCLRQTGISMGIVIANIFGMLGPYIVYLGKHYHASLPFGILSAMFTLGTICGLFTAETFNQKLPDSIEDATHFGEGQKFFSVPRVKKASKASAVEATADEAEEMNQIKYAP